MKITAVTVCYNTPELISLAVSSIKKHYPSLEIIIVDGSEKTHPCSKQCDIIKNNYSNVSVIHTYKNIGHGKGLHLGIRKSRSDYILVFDSDIEMKKSCLDLMVKKMPGNYGVGQVVKVDDKGLNSDSGIDYLHPYFALISRKMYNALPGFKNCGAPAIDTMRELDKFKIPVCNFDLSSYVLHKERGTREAIDSLKARPRKVWTYQNSRKA